MHCTHGAHVVRMRCARGIRAVRMRCRDRAVPARRSSCPRRSPSICTGCRSWRARPPPTARRSTTGCARSAPCLPCAARRRRAASGSASRRREAPPASAATLPSCARASLARAWVQGRALPLRPPAAAAGRRGCSWRPCCSCRPCDASAQAAARRAAARAGAAAWERNQEPGESAPGEQRSELWHQRGIFHELHCRLSPPSCTATPSHPERHTPTFGGAATTASSRRAPCRGSLWAAATARPNFVGVRPCARSCCQIALRSCRPPAPRPLAGGPRMPLAGAPRPLAPGLAPRPRPRPRAFPP
eukprot:scaffold103135_cov69-Phaeocystis_antarctica.AAC.9